MAASNYMTEADTESIWGLGDFDTTRFGKIGVRIAEFINYKIYKNATTQCTNTAITPLLEEFSEEVFNDLIAAAKMNAVTNPWDFFSARVTSYLQKHYKLWEDDFEDFRLIESQDYTIEISSVAGFGSSNTL